MSKRLVDKLHQVTSKHKHQKTMIADHERAPVGCRIVANTKANQPRSGRQLVAAVRGQRVGRARVCCYVCPAVSSCLTVILVPIVLLLSFQCSVNHFAEAQGSDLYHHSHHLSQQHQQPSSAEHGRSQQLVPASLQGPSGTGGGGGSSTSSISSMFKDLSGPISGKIQTLDVICGKNFMTVRAEFSGPFYGIVFSKGTYGQENCIYVKPNSGLTHAAFNVYYDQCGTKPDLQGKFYENTVVIQYGSDIIEAYDEAKRLRCEWFEAYEKPATFKPAIPVADLEVVEMNFQGDDIDCWMEIQEGTGPMSREVSKIVPVGQPMTIVVAVNDYNGQFDMRVKSCVAHDGVQQPIALTDEFGCVLRPKMLTPFQKIRNPGGIHKKATILSYSRFLAFKFPDSMTVQIQCTVEVCRNGCADSCQRIPSLAATTMQPELSLTAKWPSNSNQPAIESQRYPIGTRSNQFHSSPASAGSIGADEHQFRPQYQAPSAAAASTAPIVSPIGASESSVSSADDMNGSESNHQPAVANERQPSQSQPVIKQQQQQPLQQQQPHHYHQQRRSHQDQGLQQQLDGRVPQYLVPRRQLPHGARLPSSTSTTSTSTTTSTTTQAPSTTIGNGFQNEQMANNRANNGPTDELDQPSGDESLTRLSSASGDQVAQGASSGTKDVDQPQDPAGESNEQHHPQASPDSSSVNGPAAGGQSSPEAGNQSKPEESQAKPQMVNEDEPRPNEQQSPSGAAPSVSSSESPASVVDQAGSGSGEPENKPSVQGTDDEQMKPDASEQQQQSQQASQQSASVTGANNSPSSASNKDSALKTVEVEIPANEDPVRAFMASANQRPSFNSVRFSNAASLAGLGDLDQAASSISSSDNEQPLGHHQVNFESAYESSRNDNNNNNNQQGPAINANEHQVIQPRDRQPLTQHHHQQADQKRDKHDDEANLEAVSQLLSSGRVKFGARSQPQQAATGSQATNSDQPTGSAQPAAGHRNHQMAAAAPEPSPASDQSLLIDRSDDSSLTSELAPSATNQVAADRRSSVMDATDESSPSSPSVADNLSAEESSLSSSKQQLRPVVGTDELATGPIQIEDRIGAPAPSSALEQHDAIEQGLNRAKQQPQAAALTSSESQVNGASHQQVSESNQAHSPGGSYSNAMPTQAANQRPSSSTLDQHQLAIDSPNDRADNSQAKQVEMAHPQQQQQQQNQQQQQQKAAQPIAVGQSMMASAAELTQHHPNVMGQAKVIPDPSGILNSRGTSMLTSSSDVGEIKMQIPGSAGQQAQQQQSGKPVAQITNIPISLGIAPNQMAGFQQLSQQLAQFQQQQQQQQQQQVRQVPTTGSVGTTTTTTTTSTAKPALRSRFNLLNPQAALRNVASRLLPKSVGVSSSTAASSQPQQTSRLPSIAQHLPQLLNNIKSLPVEQQQKLLANAIQHQQVAFANNGHLAKPQIPTQQYYNFVNGFQQTQQPPAPVKQSASGGLFGRFSGAGTPSVANHQQQPLIRSRRSALTPNGKRASGEVGVQKTFMVVTGMDLAFTPNLNDTELPQILEGRRLSEPDEVVYGICMPILSFTFVLTCAFWLFVFLVGFCIYMLNKTRRNQRDALSSKLADVQ